MHEPFGFLAGLLALRVYVWGSLLSQPSPGLPLNFLHSSKLLLKDQETMSARTQPLWQRSAGESPVLDLIPMLVQCLSPIAHYNYFQMPKLHHPYPAAVNDLCLQK